MVVRAIEDLKPTGIYLWSRNFLELLYKFRTIKETQVMCDKINMINNQQITDIDFTALTYKWKGTVYSLLDMGTAEKMFLVTCCAVRLGVHLEIADYPDELSPKASRLYLSLFKGADVVIYIKNRFSAFAGVAQEEGLFEC